MNAISKNILFYITIVENNKMEHSFLRSVIHKVLPQAIVESVYSYNEAVEYFKTCSIIPHLIFLDRQMLKDTVDVIKGVNDLCEVPIVLLNDLQKIAQNTDFIKQSTNLFYSKPYDAKDLLNIVGSVNSNWLA